MRRGTKGVPPFQAFYAMAKDDDDARRAVIRKFRKDNGCGTRGNMSAENKAKLSALLEAKGFVVEEAAGEAEDEDADDLSEEEEAAGPPKRVRKDASSPGRRPLKEARAASLRGERSMRRPWPWPAGCPLEFAVST